MDDSANLAVVDRTKGVTLVEIHKRSLNFTFLS